jgi:hypothetical protein
MANNNSTATSGYLIPDIDPTDSEIRGFFHAMVVGITGLNGKNVRPMWQPNPPKQLDLNVDWCAFGLVNVNSDANAYVKTNNNGEAGTLTRDEAIELLAVFYGPNAMGYASMLRDGLEISQNRWVLRQNGIAFIGQGGITHAPELINDIWYERQDLTLNFTREVRREYNVLSFVGAQDIILTDVGLSRTIDVFEQEALLADEDDFLIADGSGDYLLIGYKKFADQSLEASPGFNLAVNGNNDILITEVD